MSLPKKLLAQLSRLKLQSRYCFSSKFKGEHQSTKHGAGLEFADYRAYQLGDELSHVDWNLYARSRRSFVKVFQFESDLTVSLLIEGSISMDFGMPKKIDLARNIALALSYVVLNSNNRVQLYACQENLTPISPSTFGLSEFFHLSTAMEGFSNLGSLDLATCLRQFTELNQPGLVILISDFFDHTTYQDMLTLLVKQKFEVVLIQILSLEELDPDLSGEAQLVDVETQKSKDVSVTKRSLSTYKKNLEHFLDQIQNFCQQHSITYLQTNNQNSLEQIILENLRKVGLIGTI
ncbi:DUF58 domain-containing protein [Candidatus Poribacteria bacterium]|nr:DUF58 domain-containing protein [Candidatus Poribacteria bacterium]